MEHLLNLPQQHLLLNHLPIIGTFVAFGLFLVSLVSKKDDLKKASLVIFALIALVAIPSYTSGHAAYAVIQNETDVSKATVDAHQGAALMAVLAMEITGALACVGLWQYRRTSSPAPWTLPAVLFLSFVTAALLTVTGNTGGDIRHVEIRSAQETTSFVSTMGGALFSTTQRLVLLPGRWGGMWPVLETLHFLGLTLLFGTLGILDLRILGYFKRLPVAHLLRFVPWAMTGFVVNVITGMLFFIGMPQFYVYNLDFHLKMFGVLLAGSNILLLFFTGAFPDCENLEANQEASLSARFFAGTCMILIVAVIVLGRYMPYFEDTLTSGN